MTVIASRYLHPLQLVAPQQDGGCPRAGKGRCLALLGGMVAALLVGWAGSASATCNKTITVTETQQMNFGTIGAATAGGTVTLSPSGTATGPASFLLTGAPVAGKFLVTGSPNCLVTISFIGGTLTAPTGGAPMTIKNFQLPSGFNPTIQGVSGGQLTFSVGADLVVNASQAGGDYAGTYTVTVVY